MNFFKLRNKIILAFLLILIPITFGVGGYMIIEDARFVDSLFMTIITVATVGYGEVFELSDAGRIFTVVLIITNLGIFAYAISLISSYLIEGQFFEQLRKNRMKKRIADLEEHVIVCGFGRNGHAACIMLKNNNIPYVIIEQREELLNNFLNDEHAYFLHEDATKDDSLLNAGIRKARGLITTLPSDAENVYVVLTARELNQNMTIISRASDNHSITKLKRAGANNVIMPDRIGGAHMASLIVRPDVKEFLDIISGQGGSDVQLDEFPVADIRVGFNGKTLRELDIRHKTGANVVGLKSDDGDYVINPEIDRILNHEDILIILGTSEQMMAFKSRLS